MPPLCVHGCMLTVLPFMPAVLLMCFKRYTWLSFAWAAYGGLDDLAGISLQRQTMVWYWQRLSLMLLTVLTTHHRPA